TKKRTREGKRTRSGHGRTAIRLTVADALLATRRTIWTYYIASFRLITTNVRHVDDRTVYRNEIGQSNIRRILGIRRFPFLYAVSYDYDKEKQGKRIGEE